MDRTKLWIVFAPPPALVGIGAGGALVHFDGPRGIVGCPSISLAQALRMPHKHNAARRHHIPKMSFTTGCGFPALPGWGSTHDQAKTWDCRVDATVL